MEAAECRLFYIWAREAEYISKNICKYVLNICAFVYPAHSLLLLYPVHPRLMHKPADAAAYGPMQGMAKSTRSTDTYALSLNQT